MIESNVDSGSDLALIAGKLIFSLLDSLLPIDAILVGFFSFSFIIWVIQAVSVFWGYELESLKRNQCLCYIVHEAD